MSLKPIPAKDLFQIANGISRAKEDTLISKYYNAILVAVHEGKFHITFTMDSDHFGAVIPEEWSAMGKVERLFPGVPGNVSEPINDILLILDSQCLPQVS